MYRQVIIARKDLNMTPGKLAAQVSHASEAFIMQMIKAKTIKVIENVYVAYASDGKPQRYRRPDLDNWAEEARQKGEKYFYVRQVNPNNPYGALEKCDKTYHYETKLKIDNETYEQWINGIFTKTVCEAKNKNQLMKVVDIAKELGLQENIDYFIIKDNCLTELEPEEVDENGVGRTITCIGFRPLEDELAHRISKKYQLYK